MREYQHDEILESFGIGLLALARWRSGATVMIIAGGVLASTPWWVMYTVADTVCFLDDGVILEQAAPQDLFNNPQRPRTQQFLQRIVEAGRL